MFFEQMKKEQQSVEKRIARIEKKLNDMPEGKLICARNGNKYKWYVSNHGERVYLPKDKRSIAAKLAQKRHLMTLLEEIKCEKRAIEEFFISYSRGIAEIDKEYMENEELCNLLELSKTKCSNDMSDWMNEPYERSQKHPEHLIHRTSWGEVFRSKSEAMIAVSLRERGIPYRYECALKLGGETFFPDFTIRHPKTGQIYYYEHFGKMDDPKYINDNMPKLPLYAMHGIVPGVNLLMSFETKQVPLSMYTIECLLTQYFS